MNLNKIFRIGAVTILSVALLLGMAGILDRLPLRVNAQQGGSFYTINPNANYPGMVFTATSQTKTQIIAGCSTATVEVFGTALTTVTWQMLASNDGGAHYFAIPNSTGAYTSNVLTVTTGAAITTTAATLYYFNLSGFTNYEVTTSGTFTATNVTVKTTCSSNKGIL